jgi:2-isopropylmalate synthase
MSPAQKGMSPGNKYRPYSSQYKIPLKERSWTDKEITKAPIWCSVDLRDGNQALINPMNLQQKLEMFGLLAKIGFKEIEIGFPSASAVEFDFTRELIEKNLIPDDVAPQVLVQAREHLIDRTFEAIKGAKKVVFHVYNSVSELQRRVVFNKNRDDIKKIAVDAIKHIKKLSKNFGGEILLEYSPESFTGTEIDFSIDICEAVLDAWGASAQNKIILNLPATVEMATPNIYADQIEYFAKTAKNRDSYILSLHPHNDRGTAVAAAELALCAGADRIEGTLFGNGERTGNVDIITLALNMYSQGINPQLDLRDINEIKQISDRCTNIPVHMRHPYAGELVFTAFSGSHQDAIRKGTIARQSAHGEFWEVPYLPIDPGDVGRKYEPVIRINSQSGKGGVAYRMETDYGYSLPKAMHPEFSRVIQNISDTSGQEVTSKQIWDAFSSTYLAVESPYKFIKFSSNTLATEDSQQDKVESILKVEINGEMKELKGAGNGPIDACMHALLSNGSKSFKLTDFSEHALSAGSDAEAAAYIQIETEKGDRFFGVGQDPNTIKASIKALLCALNRAA